MTDQPVFSLSSSRGFLSWLRDTGGSLSFTTYQAGKIFFIGIKPGGGLSIFERSFPRCMGLAASADGRTLLMATQAQLYRFDNVLAEGETSGDNDALYAPKQTWITGDLDVHDVAFGAEGPVFANTLFNCVATVSEGFSFRPLWRPPFISRLAAEDRCHLNGLAMDDGELAYATCVSRSDIVDGWRDHRVKGGILVDIRSNEVVAEGLSMPHSPRYKDGKVWLLNSGAGEFGHVDPATGQFTAIADCPGYARGLTILDGHAIVGLSQSRDNRTFQELPLDQKLKGQGAVARCGLLVIDMATGDTVEWVRIDGVVSELFDVAFLPGVRCSAAIGLKGRDILKVINIDA